MGLRVASGWEYIFLICDNIFMHDINEFKANEMGRLTKYYLLCAFA
jgi:hypothetical protein